MQSNIVQLCFGITIAVNLRVSSTIPWPNENTADTTQAQKFGEIEDLGPSITLDKIKSKLKESNIFDVDDCKITDIENKELSKLFTAVEIMTTSRNRQPSSAQNMFSTLRIVERAVKKQLKEGQISDSLAEKFHWENLNTRAKSTFKVYEKGIKEPTRNPWCTKSTRKFRTKITKPSFYLDKKTNMRVFMKAR